MSGIGFWEFIFLCMIGLVVLGPKRLPAVATQIGTWVGQARRMTRTLRRQLEEELNLDNELNIRPSIQPASHPPPRDDDGFSPLHDENDENDESGDAATGAETGDDGEPPGDETLADADEETTRRDQ